jgi:hypothetical protein
VLAGVSKPKIFKLLADLKTECGSTENFGGHLLNQWRFRCRCVAL